MAACGLLLRLVYVLVLSRGLHDSGDSEFFHRLAGLIGAGRGFADPIGFSLTGSLRPTALHPPLYPLFLGGFSWLGAGSYLDQRVIGCVVGAAAIVAVGLLGRRVGGERVGLIAAALAAVYPTLIAADGAVMSESLYGLLVVLCLLASYRLSERPGAVGRAVIVGALIALAALTRAEALALLVLALAPAAVIGVRSGGGVGAAWRPVAIGVLACLVVLAPWSARNWHAFGRPILVSNNSGTLLAGANCDATYHGSDLGSWNIRCVPLSPSTNEAVTAAAERRAGLSYVGDHAGRVPAVIAVRLLRTFDLYQPGREARRAEGRSARVDLAGAIAFWLLAPVAVWGALLLRRRRQPLVLLLGPFGLAVATTVVGYGIPRFRHPADLALLVLAAVAYEQLLSGRAGARWLTPRAAQ